MNLALRASAPKGRRRTCRGRRQLDAHAKKVLDASASKNIVSELRTTGASIAYRRLASRELMRYAGRNRGKKKLRDLENEKRTQRAKHSPVAAGYRKLCYDALWARPDFARTV